MQKSATYSYSLRTHKVCKYCFLTTLGYNKDNSSAIKCAFSDSNDSKAPLDKRGKHEPARKIDRELVINHIESFGPKMSHYRRMHAPNRRYLPADLSLREMYDDFLTSAEKTIAYNTYYQIFSQQNIAFTKLANEQCEQCEEFELHKKNCDCEFECKQYQTYIADKRRYTKARIAYQSDAEKPNNTSEPIVSADLQKVILIPRMDQFKRSIFTSRLCVYNETFTAIGTHTKRPKDKTIVWHEAIAGRRDEDVTSAFHKFLLTYRDAQILTLWMDNCSAQNKNYTIFTMIRQVMASGTINAREVNLNFFEPGHSFMSADATHSKLEKSLKQKQGKIFYFNDLVNTFVSTGRL